MNLPVYPYQVAVRHPNGAKTLLAVAHYSEDAAVSEVMAHLGLSNVKTVLVGLPTAAEMLRAQVAAEDANHAPA